MNKLPERDYENIWNKYENILRSFKDENIDKFLDEQGQRLLESSYSLKTTEPFCGPCGIIESMTEMAINAKKINDALGYCISNSSILKTCLLSEIGRIGTLSNNRLEENDSSWHKENLGQFYKWNESCDKYNIYDMSLWFCQKYGIYLSYDEWQSINLLKDLSKQDMIFYAKDKSRLSIVLCVSKEATIKNELDKLKGLYTVPF